MRWVLPIVTVAVGGCLVVPRESTTKRVVASNVRESALKEFPLLLQTSSVDDSVRVFASIPRVCQRTLVEDLEVTHTRKVGLTAPDDDGLLIIAIMMAPFTLPVSGLITALIVSGDDWVTAETRSSENGTQPCPLTAAIPLELALPSGSKLSWVTDAKGYAAIPVPAAEPDHGIVTVRVGDRSGQAMAPVHYYRTYAACSAERDRLIDEANRASGRAAVLQQIPRCASVTTGIDVRREQIWDLAIGAALAAAKGDCRFAFDADTAVRSGDPQIHATVFEHPQLAACFGRDDPRRATMSECEIKRVEAMRAAQLIRNPNQRGEALRRIPRCPSS